MPQFQDFKSWARVNQKFAGDKVWQIVQSDGTTARDISGDTNIYFTVKINKSDADVSAIIATTGALNTTGVDGRFKVTLTAIHTATAYVGQDALFAEYKSDQRRVHFRLEILPSIKLA